MARLSLIILGFVCLLSACGQHEVVHRQGTGLVASTYLLPDGWTVQDQLYWEYNDATVPIRYKGKFTSGDGKMLIQSYPDVRSVWSTGPSGTSGYHMRRVERYSDGQSRVSLPSGYSGAWVNDKGEYLLSNTQGFDPNTQMNGAWKALQKN